MTPQTPSELYIATEVLPRVPSVMHRNRSRQIEDARQERCLTPNGHFLFLEAILCYIAGRREDGDELVVQATEFLRLAQETGEGERDADGAAYSEGARSAELSYLHWLSTGGVDDAMLADARSKLGIYSLRQRGFTRLGATLAVPILLYAEDYPLILKIAQRFSIGTDVNARRGATGLFGHALRIAEATNEKERQDAKSQLRKKLPGQLFAWINKGHFDDVAYALHALFPRPAGPPSQLIEEVWNWIPEKVIRKWLDNR